MPWSQHSTAALLEPLSSRRSVIALERRSRTSATSLGREIRRLEQALSTAEADAAGGVAVDSAAAGSDTHNAAAAGAGGKTWKDYPLVNIAPHRLPHGQSKVPQQPGSASARGTIPPRPSRPAPGAPMQAPRQHALLAPAPQAQLAPVAQAGGVAKGSKSCAPLTVWPIQGPVMAMERQGSRQTPCTLR